MNAELNLGPLAQDLFPGLLRDAGFGTQEEHTPTLFADHGPEFVAPIEIGRAVEPAARPSVEARPEDERHRIDFDQVRPVEELADFAVLLDQIEAVQVMVSDDGLL